MILLIDNYDSFSYNVYQLVGSVNPDIKVIRNDEMTVHEIEALAPSHIILSPGPGRPADAGVCEEVIRYFAGKIPILGICLGHQAICEVFGATITYAKELMHGKQSVAALDTKSLLFRGMDSEMTVARYHSLAAKPDSMPPQLKVTAKTADGEVMAVEHTEFPVYGVQFHPESVLTPEGKKIMENFLKGEQKSMLSGNSMIKEAIIKLSRKEDIGYEIVVLYDGEQHLARLLQPQEDLRYIFVLPHIRMAQELVLPSVPCLFATVDYNGQEVPDVRFYTESEGGRDGAV